MKLAKPFVIITVLLSLASPLHAGQSTPESPQSLYLQAGKEERSGSTAKAREIYESIIDRFPDSEFAVKANDRLLTLPTAAKQTDSAPAASSGSFFAPRTLRPLPAEPLLRRGVEAARMKTSAEVLRKNELDRERQRFTVREGHRVNRSVLAEKEDQWQKAADRKVLAEFGMTLAEIAEKLKQVCIEAKVAGECSEDAFYLLSAPP